MYSLEEGLGVFSSRFVQDDKLSDESDAPGDWIHDFRTLDEAGRTRMNLSKLICKVTGLVARVLARERLLVLWLVVHGR
jgi:hypothetical protein